MTTPPPPGYGGYPQQPTRQTSSDAIVALVLSLLAWVFCPVILAVVALVFASKAKTAIDASNGWLDGAGMVTAAKIIAWINIAVTILGTIAFILFFVILGAASTTVDTPSTGNAIMSLLH
jgi:hypothetical protein